MIASALHDSGIDARERAKSLVAELRQEGALTDRFEPVGIPSEAKMVIAAGIAGFGLTSILTSLLLM